MDAFAGLMNVAVGHGREAIVAEAAAQMAQLPFVPSFFGMTNAPAISLAERLRALTPEPIDRILYVGSGSEATDTAIKLARLRFSLDGRPEKHHIIARHGSYRGQTYGAVTVSGVHPNKDGIGPLLPGVSHIESLSPDALEAEILRIGAANVAAFIAEPVAGPAGVHLPDDDHWPAVQRILRRHDVLLILDEVVCGFGRTGRMFGADRYGIAPDLMLMAKGLTSGYFPLAAVGVSREVSELLEAREPYFRHGFTAGGHPVGCAVVHATIDIIESEGLVENAEVVGAWIRERLATELPGAEIRGVGLFIAMDLAPMGGSGPEVVARLRRRRVLARAYGDAVVVGPPLSITRAEAALLVDALLAAVRDE